MAPTVEADLVLVGVGISPNASLAETAGLAIGNGITVDEHLRTSDPDVYAAGDVADAFHPLLGQRLRVEHWANARTAGGGRRALHAGPGRRLRPAAVLLHRPVRPRDGVHRLRRTRRRYDDVVVRGDLPGARFVAFWLADGRVLAGMNVNVWDATEAVEELITTGRRVDAALLADPGVPLPTG